MDHSRAPILEALSEYRRRGIVPFTSPGHKQGRRVDSRLLDTVGRQVFTADVISLNGLDDRRMTGQVLQQAQALMADAVGADHAFFSTCGSSMSVKAAMLAVAAPHQKLLVARNVHKSVVAGLILAGIQPVWVAPRWDPDLHLAHPAGPEAVAEAFGREPDAVGMLLTTPTDWGSCSSIRAVADVCHDRGRPLIVDEAWGAHLPFHPDLPTWALDADADLCVASVHKMGFGLEQSSVYYLRGDRVDATRLSQRADLLDTTSPSAVIYAVLDGWRRHMVQHGHQLLETALELAERLREQINLVDGLHTVDEQFVGPALADTYDPLKVVVDVQSLGINGFQASDWLRQHRNLTVGLPDHRRITAQVTIADNQHTTNALVGALRALSRHAEQLTILPSIELPDGHDLGLDTPMLPRDAFFAETEQVPAAEAVGRIAAEMISPYPPGIPLFVPGERINRAVIDYLRSGLAARMHIVGAADPSLDTIRVVAASTS